jgi:hypothetical protein
MNYKKFINFPILFLFKNPSYDYILSQTMFQIVLLYFQKSNALLRMEIFDYWG